MKHMPDSAGAFSLSPLRCGLVLTRLLVDLDTFIQTRCFPMSGLQPASMNDGIERYAHCQGEVMFRRRAPMQVAATLGQKSEPSGLKRPVRSYQAQPFG